MQRWQAAFRYIGLGWFVAACILSGGFGGQWLDNHMKTEPLFTITGLIAGTALAFYGIYRMILPTINKKNDQRGR